MSVVTRQWWDGLDLVGRRLRSYLPGKIVGGNGSYHTAGLAGGTDPSGPFKGSNVTMNEVLQAYTSKPDTGRVGGPVVPRFPRSAWHVPLLPAHARPSRWSG